MKLLVSVRSAEEARAALAGGADIIDAKEPRNGALGAVKPGDLHSIVDAVGGLRPVSAALGEASDATQIARSLRDIPMGVDFVKIGFAGMASGLEVENFARVASRALHRAQLILVGYADADRAGSIAVRDLIPIARRSGARGLLLDTFDKQGPAVRDRLSDHELQQFVDAAHREGLIVAIAGKLTADDIGQLADAGADIAGVRGAACDGGRDGYVSAARVQKLSAAMIACATPAGSARMK